LVLHPGEEAFKTIADFANRERITGGSVSAIGAFEGAKLGWFDLDAKSYQPITVDQQCEVLSLVGDIAEVDDLKSSLHLHAALGRAMAAFAAVTSFRVSCGRPSKSSLGKRLSTSGVKNVPIWVSLSSRFRARGARQEPKWVPSRFGDVAWTAP
jgi:hypothetical protein